MISSIDPSDRDTAARIVAIQRAGYAVEAALMDFDGIPQLTETAEEVAALEELSWLGSFNGSELAGLIAWEQNGDVLDIDRLVVDPQFARQGRGRQLVQSVPRSPITVVSTGTANLPALTLYSSLGFYEIGRTEIASGVFTTQLERRLG